ncbi:MAG: hypothetical protein AAGA58_14240 [Verrucomicrobiota bacterium]
MKAVSSLICFALFATTSLVDAGEVVKRTVRYGNSSVSSQYVFQSGGSSSYRGSSYYSTRHDRARYARTSYCRRASPYVSTRYYYPGYRTTRVATAYRYPSRVYVTRPQVLRTASGVVVVRR